MKNDAYIRTTWLIVTRVCYCNAFIFCLKFI